MDMCANMEKINDLNCRAKESDKLMKEAIENLRKCEAKKVTYRGATHFA